LTGQRLAVTSSLLFDCHAHTSDLSYCCDPEITPQTYRAVLAQRPDLSGIAITNHGFAVYFPASIAWSAEFIRDPSLFDQYRDFGNQRLEQHLAEAEPLREYGVFTGIEVEMMDDGRVTLDPQFRSRLEVMIGSVHFLPGVDPNVLDPEQTAAIWWEHTERLAAAGIDILGHPFRWIARTGRVPVTIAMIARLVELAKRHRIALEINSHSVISGDLELLSACVQAGVEVAFGTDSHSVAEIGCLDYQVKLLAAAGLTPENVRLWVPARLR